MRFKTDVTTINNDPNVSDEQAAGWRALTAKFYESIFERVYAEFPVEGMQVKGAALCLAIKRGEAGSLSSATLITDPHAAFFVYAALERAAVQIGEEYPSDPRRTLLAFLVEESTKLVTASRDDTKTAVDRIRIVLAALEELDV